MVKPPYRRGSHGGLVYVRFISFSFFLVSGSWFLCLASEVLIVRPSNLHTDPWAGDGRNCLLPEEVHLNTFGDALLHGFGIVVVSAEHRGPVYTNMEGLVVKAHARGKLLAFLFQEKPVDSWPIPIVGIDPLLTNTTGNRGEPSRIVPEVVNESVTISLPSRKTRCTHSITSAYHLI